MVAFSVYFVVVNPVLEEHFWRRVMRARLELDMLGPLQRRGSAPRAQLITQADAVSASAYSAYHSVIIASLMPPWFNLGVAFPFLVVCGLFLTKLVDHPRLGLRTAIAFHSGLDLATACWILDLRFGWLDHVFAHA